MRVAVVIDVPDEWSDEAHSSGFTPEGYDALSRQLMGFDVVIGPTIVSELIDEQDLEVLK